MMTTGKEATERHAFILRLWREGGRTAWRGRVQHVASGEDAPVRNVDDLLAFIERQAGKLTEAAKTGLK